MPEPHEVRAKMLSDMGQSENIHDQDFCKLLRLLDLPDDMAITDMVVAAGLNKDIFRDIQLKSLDFAKKDLSSFTFTTCELDDVDLSYSQCNEVMFLNSKVAACKFVGVRAKGLGLTNCEVGTSSFSNCELEGFNVNDVRITGCGFEGSQCFQIQALQTLLQQVSFKSSYINSALFEKCKILDSYFESAELLDVSFVKTELVRVTFQRARLEKCNFQGNDLRQCDFTGAMLPETNFFSCSIRKEAFDRADLEGARFGENPGLDHRGEDEFAMRGAIFPYRVRGLEPA